MSVGTRLLEELDNDTNTCENLAFKSLKNLDDASVYLSNGTDINLKKVDILKHVKKQVHGKQIFYIVLENHSSYKVVRHRIFRRFNCPPNILLSASDLVKDRMILSVNSRACTNSSCAICGSIVWKIEQVIDDSQI